MGHWLWTNGLQGKMRYSFLVRQSAGSNY